MGIPRLHLVLGVVVILLKRMYDDRLYSLCVSRKGRIYSFVFFQHRGLGGLLSTRLDTPLFALFFTTSLGSWTLSSRLSSLPPFSSLLNFSLPRLLSLLFFIHAECIYSPCPFFWYKCDVCVFWYNALPALCIRDRRSTPDVQCERALVPTILELRDGIPPPPHPIPAPSQNISSVKPSPPIVCYPPTQIRQYPYPI